MDCIHVEGHPFPPAYMSRLFLLPEIGRSSRLPREGKENHGDQA